MLGLVVSEDSSSHYYLCMARDLNFGGRFAFTAATGVAIYRSGSEGLHLGGEALFRSGLEFSVQINERLEVGGDDLSPVQRRPAPREPRHRVPDPRPALYPLSAGPPAVHPGDRVPAHPQHPGRHPQGVAQRIDPAVRPCRSSGSAPRRGGSRARRARNRISTSKVQSRTVWRAKRSRATAPRKHLKPHCVSAMPGTASRRTQRLNTRPIRWRSSGSS